jgi:hypothetical protein
LDLRRVEAVVLGEVPLLHAQRLADTLECRDELGVEVAGTGRQGDDLAAAWVALARDVPGVSHQVSGA